MSIRTTVSSAAFTESVDAIVIQTDDATPIVVSSMPVGFAKVVTVRAFLTVYDIGMNNGAVLEAQTVFARKESGSLIRVAAPSITVIVNTFVAPTPTVGIVANATTNAIEVTVTGKTGASIRWHAEVTYKATP